MPRVLLLLPTTSWRAEALLAACTRLGVEATVGTDRPLVWADRTPDKVIALDFARPAAAAETVATFAGTQPIAAVIGADDETTVLAAAVSARLGLPHDPVEALAATRDKFSQRKHLAAAGLPVPRFIVCRLDGDPAAVARFVGFPCVIKPRQLAASRGVMRADDVASLAAAMRRLGALLASPEVGACGEMAETAILESFIPGREVAVEGLLEDGRLRVLALFDKPDPLDGPYFEETLYVTPSGLPADVQAAIADTTERAARALGLSRGPVHAELRVDDGNVWLIELAARPIGGLCSRVLRFGDGVSLEALLLMSALGMETATLVREPCSAGVMMIPIPGPGVLERVEGVDDAASVSGIERVIITAHPGERLVPFPEGSRYPGFLFARGEAPSSVEQALREGHRRLRFVVAALALALLAGCGAPRQAEPPAPEPLPAAEIQPATIEQLQQAVRAGGARLVLLNVWATWCVPCREEFPDLMRIRREYRERGLRLVLVSADTDSQIPAAKRFLAEQGVDFLTYLKQGADMPFIDSLDARWSGALPATLLYDGTGRKLWFHEGKTTYDSLKTRIEGALTAPAKPGR
jgi:biotin carboxylase/thiol-disulfide isomerase/thioredoxin